MRFILVLIVAVGWGSVATAFGDEAPASPLAAYVHKKDDSYQWVKRREGTLGKASFVELTLTSQTWRGITWKHQLFVLKPASTPKEVQHGMLFITGGRWKPELEQPPSAKESLPRDAQTFATIAERLQAPVAVLLQVPFQPIFNGKVEDAAIAYTFEMFLRTGDAEWPLLLPMAKAAVRGMDAVQEAAKKEWDLDLKSFTVTGASKRGWTTWLTGAVDPRATAIAPMVIDMLNTAEQMKHQVATWGDYSEQIHDYTERGLQKHLASEPGKKLNAVVDPYSYRDKLKQPKLILLGTNDRYWPLDALNLYWDGLPGDKYILYIPNNGHGLKDIVRIAGGLNALHQHVANGKRLPKLTWELAEKDGTLRLEVKSDKKPTRVDAWLTSSPTRDFRPATWRSEPMKVNGTGYVYELPVPPTGYAAMFGEAMFDGDTMPYYLSTNVKIVGGHGKTAAGGR